MVPALPPLRGFGFLAAIHTLDWTTDPIAIWWRRNLPAAPYIQERLLSRLYEAAGLKADRPSLGVFAATQPGSSRIVATNLSDDTVMTMPPPPWSAH